MIAPAPSLAAVPAAYRGRFVRGRGTGLPGRPIALTFDDGPSPQVTPRILEVLRRHHARATFFVLGCNTDRFPALVRAEVASGSAIGCHSYSHSQRLSYSRAVDEIRRCQRSLVAATGRRTELFRPPYGITNGSYAHAAMAAGMAVINWTNSGADTATRDWRVIYGNVGSAAKPGDVVLMHDSAAKGATARALDPLITRLERAGFRLVTVPELLEMRAAAARNHAGHRAPHA